MRFLNGFLVGLATSSVCYVVEKELVSKKIVAQKLKEQKRVDEVAALEKVRGFEEEAYYPLGLPRAYTGKVMVSNNFQTCLLERLPQVGLLSPPPNVLEQIEKEIRVNPDTSSIADPALTLSQFTKRSPDINRVAASMEAISRCVKPAR